MNISFQAVLCWYLSADRLKKDRTYLIKEFKNALMK